MVRRQNVVDLKEFEEKFHEQSENAREQYKSWLEMNRTLWLESVKVYNTQVELWLALQHGYLDLMKHLVDMKPHVFGPGKLMNPFVASFEKAAELNLEMVEIKKKKAEMVARAIQKYQKEAIERTVDAFDKYCSMITTGA